MKRYSMLAVGLLAACGLVYVAPAAEPPAPRHVVLVLDCSQPMAQPAWAGQTQTRLAEATDASAALLEKLAADGQHSATLVLLGHRIGLTQPAAGAARAAKVDFLRLSEGKLVRLTPAEDVEVVRENRPLLRDDVESYRSTLSELQPLGGAPLLLAVQRAAESLPVHSDEAAAIVLVTAGQGDPVAAHDARSALKARSAQLHVVRLSTAAATMPSDLDKLAAESGGQTSAPTNAAELAQALRVAAGLESARRRVPLAAAPRPVVSPASALAPAPDSVRLASQEAGAVQPPAQPLPAQPLGRDIPLVPPLAAPPRPEVSIEPGPVFPLTVSVTWWGEPVKDAKVYLRGENFDIAYDRTLEYKDPALRTRRGEGDFYFAAVPQGAYTLEITANVKNRKYQVLRPIAVDVDNGRFLIQLEKSKDAPPQP